jgi:hypothetical protein
MENVLPAWRSTLASRTNRLQGVELLWEPKTLPNDDYIPIWRESSIRERVPMLSPQVHCSISSVVVNKFP